MTTKRQRRFSLKSAATLVGANLAVLAVLLSVAELSLNHLMQHSGRIPSLLLAAMRGVYWGERDYGLIQFDPQCSEYHQSLGYTLRPGRCTFAGPEFANDFMINRMGLRDDERSLVAPQVIVLGDSHAMGWGVDQQQTFAEVIETKTGLTVLNAAVSSYGTAREILNLKRLDTSNLKVVLIQYCDNDVDENNRYFLGGNALATMPPDRYREISRTQQREGGYYFGKHVNYIAQISANALKEQGTELAGKIRRRIGWSRATFASDGTQTQPRRMTGAELFLNVLNTNQAMLEDIQIIVFDVSNYGRSGHNFATQLRASLERAERNNFRITVIDSGDVLGSEHFYRLDGHLTAAGHAAIAAAILDEMVF